MVDIEIKDVKENKLLRRKDVSFEISHLGSGTPNRVEVKEKLAAMQTVDANLTFIKSITPIYGLPKVKGAATIYDDEKTAKKLEAPFMHIRNMSKEARAEAKKASKKAKGKKSSGAKK